MNRRRHLGSVYTTYPAQEAGNFLGDKVYKIVATVVCCGLWTGAYYILVGVVNFNKKNFMEGAAETSTAELFKSETSLWILLGSYVLIAILVFRSRMGAKVKVDRKRGK